MQTHLHYHNTGIVTPQEIFAVGIVNSTAAFSSNTNAFIAYGNPMARKIAMFGPVAATLEQALGGLLAFTGTILAQSQVMLSADEELGSKWHKGAESVIVRVLV